MLKINLKKEIFPVLPMMVLAPSWSVLARPIMHRAPNGEIDEDAQNAKRTLGPSNGQYGDTASYPVSQLASGLAILVYDMLVPDNYGQTGSAEEQCTATGGLWLRFGFFFR